MNELERDLAFIEGALNVDTSLAIAEGAYHLFFPLEDSENGWADDCIEFGSLEEAAEFVGRVRLIIEMGRRQ